MGNSNSKEGGENEALKAELTLPMLKITSGGKTELIPRPEQEDIDELAKTDVDAAVELARQLKKEIADKERTRREASTDKQIGINQGAAEFRAKETADRARKLETRRQVTETMEDLAKATTVDAFLDASDRLAARQDQMNVSDLKMYIAKQNRVVEEHQSWTPDQLKRMKDLEPFLKHVTNALQQEQSARAADAQFIPVPRKAEPAGASSVQETAVQTPTIKSPKTFGQNLRALLGFGGSQKE